MLVALGFTPPERREPDGQTHFVSLIHLGDGDPPQRPTSIGQPSRLLRSILGADTDFEAYGGCLRLVAFDISTDKIVARWRMNRPPVIAGVFPEQMAALESDLEGLEDWAAAELRGKAERHLERLVLYRFHLSDDLGTHYETGERCSGNSLA
jgi:hypothetical protein